MWLLDVRLNGSVKWWLEVPPGEQVSDLLVAWRQAMLRDDFIEGEVTYA